MEILSSLLCLILLLFFVRALRRSKPNPCKLPPGPTPYPVIGNLLELGDKPHNSLAKLAMIHGPIMSLKLGQLTTIVVSSASMAREFLKTHDASFSNRATQDSLCPHNYGDFGLPFISISPRWRILRKISSAYIFNNKKLDGNQSLRQKKVQELVSIVQARCRSGDAVDIGELTFKTALNNIWNTIFSVDLVDLETDSTQGFREIVQGFFKEAGRPNMADYFPLLKKIDPQGIRCRMTTYLGKIFKLFDQLISERLQEREATAGLTMNDDVLDVLLNISEDNNEGFERDGIKHFLLVNSDLLLGGTETSSTTVEWAMAELLRNPETLQKAQVEIRETVGKGNAVNESDLQRLPYLQAVVKETFRLHPPVPFLIPRKSERDVEACGHTVPKGAQILVNTWMIGRAPHLWEKPNEFIPDRFLGSDVDVRGHDYELLPFGAGRRICPGLPLAMKMVPLMLGSLIHWFDWKPENGVAPEDINMDEKFGLTVRIAQPLRAIPLPI